jgi:hypothetical protein
MPDVSSIANGALGPLSRSPAPAIPFEGNGQLRVEQAPPAGIDRVELSDRARIPEGQIRLERVEAVRRAIAAGVYETPQRLSAAIERLLEELVS